MKSILEEQVEDYLGREHGFLSLAPLPAELRDRFESALIEQRVVQISVTGLAAVVLFDLFLLADYTRHPSVMWRCVVLRVFVATPVVLAAVLAVRRRVRAVIRECMMVLSVCVAGGVVLGVSYDLNRMDSMFSQLGFMLIVFFGSLILRQPFRYAVPTLGFMLLEDLVFIRTDHWMTAADQVACIFIVVTSVLLTAIASSIQEQQERTSLAHVLKEGFHNKALADLNDKLTALSQVDGLTGLSNRRHFDERFKTVWHEAMKAGCSLSLVMVDIDHFKKLNDTFGHIAGDRVLIQMGQILAACSRTSEDVVARFGGEEFILLLAGAGHEDAHGIAEDLQRLIAKSSLAPVEGGEVQRQVTVSCGLATIVPSAADDPLQLIAKADLSLYAAKRGGRNRVSCRICEETLSEQRAPIVAGGKVASGQVTLPTLLCGNGQFTGEEVRSGFAR